METKVCSKCNKEKDLDLYYTYKKSGNTWPYCKKCHYEVYTKPLRYKWVKEHPEEEKAFNKKASQTWKKNNPTKYRESTAKACKKYYQKNKEKIKQRNKERYNEFKNLHKM